MRTCLAAMAVTVFALPAFADKPVSTGDVYACAEIDDNDARLACYDTAVGRLKAAEEAGEVATVTRADVEQVKRDSFGFSIPSLPKLALPKLGGGDESDGEIKQIEQAVVNVRTTPYKKVIVTLENGQVWEQTDSTKIFISKKRPPQSATVKAASFGSFKMRLDNGRVFKAKRIK